MSGRQEARAARERDAAAKAVQIIAAARERAVRACCGTTVGQDHRDCPATGYNEQGVPLCACRLRGRPHAFEPGESCSPSRILPRVYRDAHGDLWMEGTDGRLHAHETQPFSRDHVERKWGPLVEVTVGG